MDLFLSTSMPWKYQSLAGTKDSSLCTVSVSVFQTSEIAPDVNWLMVHG
jgi:hypothetical protein